MKDISNRLQLVLIILSLLTLSTLLVSCSSVKEKEPITLKVMASDEYSFQVGVAEDFASKFTDIILEPVIFDDHFPTSYTQTEKFLSQQMPDVIRVAPGLYRKLVAEGMLVDLEPIIRKEQYPIDKMLPYLIEYTRAQGGGKLYGLPLWFTSQALYYNKDLFNKFSIPYPEDNMTWEDVFKLAQRFPVGSGEEDIVGLHISGYDYGEGGFILDMARTMDLPYLDPEGNQVSIQNEEWNKLFDTAVIGIQSGSVVIQSELVPEKFVAGQAAMNLSIPYMAIKLNDPLYDQERLKNRVMFDWQMVTAPINPKIAENTNWEVEKIYGINSSSQNIEAAWKYLKYIIDPDKQSVGGSIWIDDMQEIGGRSLEPFFKLPPKMHSREYPTVPGSFHEKFPLFIKKHFDGILRNEISVDEALALIQEEAQLFLNQCKEEDRRIVEAMGVISVNE